MIKNLPIFLINLERDYKRRKYITRKFKECNLSFQLIKGIDGSLLSEAEIFEKSSINKSIDSIGRKMSKGEIGCALSHLSVYRKMIEQDIKQAVILEDDIDFNCNSIEEVFDFLSKNNSSEPQVHLLTPVTSYLEGNTTRINHNFVVAKAIQALSTAGYVINLEAAEQILAINKRVWIVADDWVSYRMHANVNISCIIPNVVEENALFAGQSSITLDRKKIRKKRTFQYIFSRNKNKITSDIKKYFWYKPFKGYVKVK